MSEALREPPRRRRGRRLLQLWAAAVVLSLLVRGVRGPVEPDVAHPGARTVTIERAVADGPPQPVRIAYERLGPADAPTVVLVHGSPGSRRNFAHLGPALADAGYDVLLPDLPGFGDSTLRVDDYSIRAHAGDLLALLDALAIGRAHLVGYSMGGGPALHLWDRAPDRVASVVLLASIGVQEMELLGDHTLNHAIHAVQLLIVEVLDVLVPHFGATDLFLRARGYARNFHDSDQRPLREVLERFEPPMLVAHGEHDVLVPPAAAREHHRIVPQSELWMGAEDHFVVFREAPALAATIADFVARVEAGTAARRADAGPARVARAAEPFDPSSIPPATGLVLVLLWLLLAVSTFVSEDLTCIAAGLLAATGRLGFVAATSACLAGIVVGDVGLFLAGRWLGRPAVRRAPLRWLVTPASIERSSLWFRRRGPLVVVASRFLPGMRLPTYVAAGLLHTSLVTFLLWFLVASLLWTPLVVGAAMLGGAQLLSAFSWLEEHPGLGFGLVAGVLLLVLKVGVPALSHRGRRRLRGAWLRVRHWEFWPPWLFYLPLVAWVGWLALRHRGLAVVTASNPAIPAGGFIGESKADIYARLVNAPVPVTRLVPADLPLDERLAIVAGTARAVSAATDTGGWPLVLKPDAGQRGAGVRTVASLDEARDHLAGAAVDVVAQQHVDGLEYGLFYARHPDEEHGRIISITEKILPEVVGDGHRTVEQLVLDDDRAVAMASVYFESLGHRLADVPAPGERVTLTRLGTHCRGAVFRDGGHLRTPALEEAVDRISRGVDGFFFGRYDVRVPSAEALAEGRDLVIIELNGLTSEASHIYDRRYGLLDAYRVLFRQWSLAFAIGRANAARGARTYGTLDLLRRLVAYVRTARRRAEVRASANPPSPRRDRQAPG